MESVFLTAKWIKGVMCVFKKKKGSDYFSVIGRLKCVYKLLHTFFFLLENGVKCRTLSRI